MSLRKLLDDDDEPDLGSAWDLLRPHAEPDSEAYKLRAAAMTKLFDAYREHDPDRIEAYIDALWHEVPPWWLVLAVKRLIVERVYPTLPTPGDVRRVARELAGMDRPTYRAGRYLDTPRNTWPPPERRHAVEAGRFERLPAHVPLALPAGSHHALPRGDEGEA